LVEQEYPNTRDLVDDVPMDSADKHQGASLALVLKETLVQQS
jgi:hypothetical protein